MVLADAQTVTGAKTFADDALLVQNPAATFAYTLQGGAIAADRTLNIPVTTATDTLATLGLAQTFTAQNTIDTEAAESLIAQISEAANTSSNSPLRVYTSLAGVAEYGIGFRTGITLAAKKGTGSIQEWVKLQAARKGGDSTGQFIVSILDGGVETDALTIGGAQGDVDWPHGGDHTNFVVDEDGTGNTLKQRKTIQVQLVDSDTDLVIVDKVSKWQFHIDDKLAGMNLVYVHAFVDSAGTTGTTDIQIRNVTQAADMLSTKLTIDSGETGSDTAATAAVIDTANDDVAENDKLAVDVDLVSTGTAPKGLTVTMGFKLP